MHILKLKWRFRYFLKNKQTYDFVEYTEHLKTHLGYVWKKNERNRFLSFGHEKLNMFDFY